MGTTVSPATMLKLLLPCQPLTVANEEDSVAEVGSAQDQQFEVVFFLNISPF